MDSLERPKSGAKRRGSFLHCGKKRGRYSDVRYPGGTKSDPLNIEAAANGEDVPQDFTEPLEVVIALNPRDPLNVSSLDKKKHKADAAMLSPKIHKQQGSRTNHASPLKKDSVTADKDSKEMEQQRKKDKKDYYNNKYCYGNFDRYYGTRLQPGNKDSRLDLFKKEWFEKKAVLDIGCNVGFLTLAIAKEFGPRRILGIDIDEHLIGVARKNIRHYCDAGTEFSGKFPASFAANFGSIAQQPSTFSTKFPDNVWFRTENYVLENDELVEMVEEEFDVVMALSITKWIHLNWGDDGMRRFFKRVYRHLLPGGRFIVEPQPFPSYKKRAKMTETLKTNYTKIEFKPDDFEMYLLEEVGFERVEHLGVPGAKSKGFERPLQVYVKKGPKFLQPKSTTVQGTNNLVSEGSASSPDS